MTHLDRPIDSLSEAQVQTFIENLFAGELPAEAARAAGFHQKHSAAARLLQDPRVLKEIERAVSGQLRGVLAPQATQTLADILADATSSKTIRLATAKTVLDRAGHVAPKAPDAVGDLGRTIAEKTPAELREFIAQAQAALAERAKPVIDGKAEVIRRKEAVPASHDAAAMSMLD